MSASAGHIFVVDDSEQIRDLLHTYLSAEGFDVTRLGDGQALRDAMASGASPDVVVLDLGLPGEDGLSLTRYLRDQHDTAILIASGKGDTIDRVIGLEVGADDYLGKPFDLRELLARVRSLIRRRRHAEMQAAPVTGAPNREVRRFDNWCIDLSAHSLRTLDGFEVELSTGEFRLLREFVLNPNHVLTRDLLMERLHGRQAGPFDRSIDVQVSRLRRKIEADPEHPTMIKSIRGAGYMFVAQVEVG